jgi:superfamily I DNA/RNA helicase
MLDPKLLDYKLPHDGYLKLWQLETPDLSRRFTSIICDEAQDLNPTVIDILKNKNQQRLGLLIIGDENQAIYQFRGATNAMSEIDVDETHYLTTSFRFGSGVAAVATALLGTFRKLPRPISGFGPRTKFEIDRSKTYCTISRTNAVLFDAAVSALDTNRPFYFIGATQKGKFDPQAYRFDSMMDVHYLSLGQRTMIRDSMLRQFESLTDLIEAADDTDDRELKFLAKIAETYGERIPELIQQLERRHVPVADPKSFMQKHPNGLLFTTANKSKGLEFEQVSLTNDFAELTDDKENLISADKVAVEELNLLYVAATRAEVALSLNDSLRGALRAIQRRDKTAKDSARTTNGADEAQKLRVAP